MSYESFAAQLAASPKSAGDRFRAIIDYVRELVDDSIDAVGVDNIIIQAHELYDRFVAPLDVPWVPDVAEPNTIDRPAKQLLAALIRSFHNSIHTEG